MSAGNITRLSEAAARAAEAHTAAVRAHDAERAAIVGRNDDRTRAYWSDARVTDLMASETGRRGAALQDVRGAITEGGDVLTAYATYRRVDAECNALLRVAATFTTEHEHADGTGPVVRQLVPTVVDNPVALAALYEETVKAWSGAQASAYVSDYLQPLRDSLEPEGDA